MGSCLLVGALSMPCRDGGEGTRVGGARLPWRESAEIRDPRRRGMKELQKSQIYEARHFSRGGPIPLN